MPICRLIFQVLIIMSLTTRFNVDVDWYMSVGVQGGTVCTALT